MDEERIKEAQKILDWVIKKLGLSIKCRVVNYKDGKIPTQFFTRENKLIEAINIDEDWIEDTHPKGNYNRGELRSLLIGLARKAKRERG